MWGALALDHGGEAPASEQRGWAQHARRKTVVEVTVPALREAEYQVFVEDSSVLFDYPPGPASQPRKARSFPILAPISGQLSLIARALRASR